MGGIEVYPQKEFDEDMEDKSDNDKIRVSSVPSFFPPLKRTSGRRGVSCDCFTS